MANEEHIAILQKGTKAWNWWRGRNPTIQPDLSHMHLPNALLIEIDLSEANLREAHLTHADLTGANLVAAQLQRVHLSHSTLNGANIDHANLRQAHLLHANLNGADLFEANLQEANLSHAYLNDTNLTGSNLAAADLSNTALLHTHLSGASLEYTNLRGADMFRSDLSYADLSHAELMHTVFADIDLSEVRGLEIVRHRGPSTIGIDTIYKSNGQIPDIFLRGCGVPDIFIEYMHALTAKPFEFYSCFISYSHADEAFARRLHDTLQGRGVRCWLDEKDARLGVPVTHNIEHGIRLTDKFLLCCSKESLGSNWVNFEIDLALHRETELRREAPDNSWRIIPLDLDGHIFSPDYSGEALRIRNRLAGDFTNWKTDSDKFDRQIARVIQAIRIE